MRLRRCLSVSDDEGWKFKFCYLTFTVETWPPQANEGKKDEEEINVTLFRLSKPTIFTSTFCHHLIDGTLEDPQT